MRFIYVFRVVIPVDEAGAGLKDLTEANVINTDKDAPIFGKSDYGIIGDLFEVVPALTKELEKLE